MSGRGPCGGKGRSRAANALGALALGLLAAGCSSLSSGIADLPAPIGLPAATPPRPAVAPDYPAVHDVPPPRDLKLLTEAERKKLEADLAQARERQERRTGATKKGSSD